MSKTERIMESLLLTPLSSSMGFLSPDLTKLMTAHKFFKKPNSYFVYSNGYSSILPFPLHNKPSSPRLIVAAAKKDNKNTKKGDSHSFVPKPDEATGFFPEAVLLKEKKVQEDGRLLPDFADAEEQELFEALTLELESALDVERMRHYEVVYLIHEKYVEEVEKVNAKVQDFLREKKGRIWRFNDWGLRRLAYKIQKAKKAHYILMNFEMEAKWINDFKSLLDKDERVIRHLVIKRDKAEMEDCPPPPEFHTLRAGTDDEDIEDDVEFDDDYEEVDDVEEGDDEGDIDSETYNENQGNDIFYVDNDVEDDTEFKNRKSSSTSSVGKRKLTEKAGR